LKSSRQIRARLYCGQKIIPGNKAAFSASPPAERVSKCKAGLAGLAMHLRTWLKIHPIELGFLAKLVMPGFVPGIHVLLV
jgi:hypothetical protein